MPLVLFGIFCYTDTGKSPLWVKIRGKKEQFDEDDFFGGRRQQHWTGLQGIDLLTAEDTVLVFFGKGRPWPT